MSVFEHWCGNCQIRIYYRQHYNKDIDWQDCPYTCEYATAMRNSYSINVDTEPVKHGRWTATQAIFLNGTSTWGERREILT